VLYLRLSHERESWPQIRVFLMLSRIESRLQARSLDPSGPSIVSNPKNGGNRKHKDVGIIVGSVIGGIAVTILIVIFTRIIRRWRSRSFKHRPLIDSFTDVDEHSSTYLNSRNGDSHQAELPGPQPIMHDSRIQSSGSAAIMNDSSAGALTSATHVLSKRLIELRRQRENEASLVPTASSSGNPLALRLHQRESVAESHTTRSSDPPPTYHS
jgi:hypothetical protein